MVIRNKDSEDCNSSVDTSTVCTLSESIQLSLPESFDDTFSINGISIVPDKCSKAEVRLLHAQLLEYKRQIQQLNLERDISLRELKKFEKTNFDDEYHKVKRIPIENRSLLEHATTILHEKLSAIQSELQVALEKAKNTSELAEQQKEKAANVQVLCDQKVSNLQESLDASNERRTELEAKCKDLQSTVLDIQEKGRKYDDLINQNQQLREEAARLRILTDQKQKDVLDTKSEYANIKMKMKELERKVQGLEIDKSFMEKEKLILTKRAEKAEEETKNTQAALRDATIRCDDITMQLGEANRIAQAESESKATIQIKRIREECENELKRYRSQVEASYTRELSILREAKDEAIDQHSEAKAMVQKLRESLDSVTAQKEESIHRLERSLTDCRSDVKVKCMEVSRLQLFNEKLEQNTKVLQSEVHMLSDQVEVHKTEFKNLEQESLLQRKQLMDEIQRKEEQLEMYYQSQLNASDNKRESQSSVMCLSQRNQTHFLDKAKQLERKNLDMQEEMKQLQSDLEIQREKTKTYESKLQATESDIIRLTKQIKDNEEKAVVQHGSSNQLIAQNQHLKEDLSQARKERDKIGKEFSFLLEKYHHLVEQRVASNTKHLVSPSRSKNSNVQMWTYDATTKKAILDLRC